MARYRITVSGCDDVTSVDRDLTDAEAELVRHLAKEITDASEYTCMPTMSIGEIAS